MYKRILSKKITSIVCSASLFASSVGLQSKNISATNNSDSLYSYDPAKTAVETEPLLQKLESYNSNKVEEVKKQGLIEQFLSETKGLFPKDKNQEIRLMLEKLSTDQLKLVRNLKFKTPWKEVLKELLPWSDFLQGRWSVGLIFNLGLKPYASTSAEQIMRFLKNQIANGHFFNEQDMDELLSGFPWRCMLIPTLFCAKIAAFAAYAPRSARKANYRTLKDTIMCE